MSENLQRQELKTSNLVERLLDIQGQYLALAGLYEKENFCAQKLVGIVAAMQREVDTTISLTPDLLSERCTAAYLVTDGVVVMFDLQRQMTSRPLRSFPTNVITAVIEESTMELGRLISEKRRSESERVESLEGVLKELQKAQAAFKQAKEVRPGAIEARNDGASSSQTSEDVQPSDEENIEEIGSDPFSFKGSFGEKNKVVSY